jgi:hypothetical protein
MDSKQRSFYHRWRFCDNEEQGAVQRRIEVLPKLVDPLKMANRCSTDAEH